MERVEDAIILAGGRGTRMLPASQYVPKETLPLVDIPIINHLMLEASKSGVKRIHIVLSDWKMRILESHFHYRVEDNPRKDLPKECISLDYDDVEVISHIQRNPGGVADAINCVAGKLNGPFLVILGDNLLLEKHLPPNSVCVESASSASKLLVENYEKFGLPCVGIIPVPRDMFSEYGMVEMSDGYVVEIVEKPAPEDSPSNFALCGRYLFTPNFTEISQNYPITKYGELQSIYILRQMIREKGLKSVNMESMTLYDSGDPTKWLKSQIDHAIKRPDIGPNLKKYLLKKLL